MLCTSLCSALEFSIHISFSNIFLLLQCSRMLNLWIYSIIWRNGSEKFKQCKWQAGVMGPENDWIVLSEVGRPLNISGAPRALCPNSLLGAWVKMLLTLILPVVVLLFDLLGVQGSSGDPSHSNLYGSCLYVYCMWFLCVLSQSLHFPCLRILLTKIMVGDFRMSREIKTN